MWIEPSGIDPGHHQYPFWDQRWVAALARVDTVSDRMLAAGREDEMRKVMEQLADRVIDDLARGQVPEPYVRMQQLADALEQAETSRQTSPC